MKILCVIPTRDRYFTTLPLTLLSVINQTRKPNHILIIDDGQNIDLRNVPLYSYIFNLLDRKGISWGVKFTQLGVSMGQHYSHELSQVFAVSNGYDYIWRIDDDEVAEADCLEILEKTIKEGICAVGGLVLDPNNTGKLISKQTNTIKNINKINVQWYEQESRIIEAEHLYSSFLYKPGVAHYDMRLSRIAHREETLFTYELSKKGKVLINTSAKTWHFRNPEGGIRDGNKELWEQDEQIFRETIGIKECKVVVLDNGLGDHIVFRKIVDKIKPDVIACCYPEVFNDYSAEIISIQEAKQRYGSLDRYNIYGFMERNNWKNKMEKAYLELYGVATSQIKTIKKRERKSKKLSV